ncbi:MAG: aminotransferase class IV, partial [Calditerricola sp.]|nr:aminotransferase class IV [Calditerricola sp.]
DTEMGLHMGVSPWRRVDDNAIPARAKINGSYINAALASDDARAAGFDEAIMLTPEGHVAEGSSANLFLVRGGRLVTSPVSDSILEGITRGMVLELARDLGFETEVRPIDRTELYVAEEMFLCGTGVQIAPVTKVDHRPIGNGKPGPMTRALQERFFAAVRGRDERYAHWLTPVYGRVATTTPGARRAER